MSFFKKLFKTLAKIAPFAAIAAAPFTGGSSLSLLSVLGTGLGALGAMTSKEKQKTPSIGPPPAPPGLTPDPTSFTKPGAMGRPPLLSFGMGLTPIQERAAITTGALQGQSLYRDPQVTEYYKNLAQRSLVGESGELGSYESILPVERDYIRRILGQEIRSDDTRGFLAALLRK